MISRFQHLGTAIDRIYHAKPCQRQPFHLQPTLIISAGCSITIEMAELTKTLPASWYTSPGVYQFERRGVFAKSWYFLGPVTRFVNNAEVPYEIAQIKLRVVNSYPGQKLPDQRNELYAALKVVQESPETTAMRHNITSSGLLFVALSDLAPSFEEYFPDIEPLISRVDFTTLPHRHSLSYPGHFNWKTMVDGYQECLHCQYTHPSFSKFYPPTFYAVFNHKNFSQHIADPKKPDDGLFLYFFPNCTLNVYGGGMSSFRVCPTEDPSTTRMEFDYFHLRQGEDFKEYFKFVRQVAEEDFELCQKAQINLERGIYDRGILNPVKENGVICEFILASLPCLVVSCGNLPLYSTKGSTDC